MLNSFKYSFSFYGCIFCLLIPVQAQAAEYLKRKVVEKSRTCSSFRTETKSAASTVFRNGIKKRHARELRKHQSLQQNIEF